VEWVSKIVLLELWGQDSAASLSIAINTPVAAVVGSCEVEQLILHCLYRILCDTAITVINYKVEQ
jgi:hypothetical protein